MSDIFWITGAAIEKTQPALTAALQSAGLQPAWIDEAHWISGQAIETEDIISGFLSMVFRWPRPALLPDFLLHNVCRSLELRERNLVLIAEEEGGLVHFAVLCSPRAVGQYNLMPHAHIAGWWALPSGGTPGLPQKLEKSGYDLTCVNWLSGEPSLLQQVQAYFPDAKPVEDEPSAAAGRLNQLIRRLDEEKCSHGLMLAGAAGGPLLATLVER
jgi:hypothetical protein